MDNLQQVIQRAKADIAKKYVFVHMPIPQIETLLAGLEEAQKRVEELESKLRFAHTCYLDHALKEEVYTCPTHEIEMKPASKDNGVTIMECPVEGCEWMYIPSKEESREAS